MTRKRFWTILRGSSGELFSSLGSHGINHSPPSSKKSIKIFFFDFLSNFGNFFISLGPLFNKFLLKLFQNLEFSRRLTKFSLETHRIHLLPIPATLKPLRNSNSLVTLLRKQDDDELFTSLSLTWQIECHISISFHNVVRPEHKQHYANFLNISGFAAEFK